MSGLTGEGKKILAAACGAANPCKPAHGIGAVEVALHHLPHDWPEVSVLAPEQRFIPGEEGIEMGGEYAVEHGAFRMPLPVYACHTGKKVLQESGWPVLNGFNRRPGKGLPVDGSRPGASLAVNRR